MIDAIVTGQSLPALQSALDLAEVGLKVVVLSPAPADSLEPLAERDPEGSIADFITRIAEPIEQPDQPLATKQGAEDFINKEMSSPPLLFKQGEWFRQSSPVVLGVPAVPLASENIVLLGANGSFRAYLDRITPLLTVGKTKFLGDLVRKRMGAKVRDELVDPQTVERFGVLAEEVEVAVAAPGLNEALSRSGALSSAVLAYSDRNVARETRVSSKVSPEDFRRAIVKRLKLYGVEVLEALPVSVSPEGDGWVVQLSDGSSLRSRALVADIGRSPVTDSATLQLAEAALPTRARVHAVIDMEPPAWLDGSTTAVTVLDGWSLSYELLTASEQPADDGESNEPPREYCQLSVASGVGEVGELSAVLARIHSTGRLPISSSTPGIGLSSDHVVRAAGLTAAPFCTVSGRTEAANALAKLEMDSPSLLCVGRSLHGDDQGAAMGSAHKATVRLRRRLLGLEN